MITRLVPSALLALTLSGGTSAWAEGLHLAIENVRSDRGSIIVLVFDNARDFNRLDYLNAVDYADVPARPGRLDVSFPRLASGPYAVFLFHDENGDQDLNYRSETLLEGAGATGAPNPDDVPGFEEAAVLPGTATVILHYDQ